MKFQFRSITFIAIAVVISSFTFVQQDIKEPYYIKYTIQTMDGDKSFEMNTEDGFNASIIDSQSNELEIEITDDANDQNKIKLICEGSMSIGKHKVTKGNFFSDSFKKSYKYHSDMYLNILSIDNESATGEIVGNCYDIKVSHNYKMKLKGSFRLMILK